jgi:ABC-type transporter Mla subunit MlaD
MEESIKIQEEFENLIEQLERLKNINELTSANAESSQKVLKQIDKFILSTNEYKKKLEEDLTLKSDSIDKLILHLDKSIDSLDIQSQALTKNINSSFSILKDETGSNFSSLTEAVSDKIESAQQSVANLKNTLIEKSEKSESNLIEYHTKQINTLTSKIDEYTINFIKKFETQDKEIKTLKTLLFIICGLIVIGIIITILK